MNILPGDILLKKCDYSFENICIVAGQISSKGPAHIVHAAIAVSQTKLVETLKKGPEITEVEAGETYNVFRCHQRIFADKAAEFAEFTAINTNKLGYKNRGRKGALLSVLNRSPLNKNSTMNITQRVMEGDYSFFCSSHVAFCYQYALAKTPRSFWSDEIEDTFKLEHHCYNPSYLYRRLCKSHAFSRVGMVTGF